jgi:FG-GAP-like repeat
VVADFNHDGNLDIAMTGTCGQNCGVVSILLGNGDGTFASYVDYTTGMGPMTLVAADFNGDSFVDLAVVDACGTTCGSVSILLGKGDGTFQGKTDYSIGQNPYGIVVQDFSGDGKLDLAVANTSNTISILLGNGDGTFQPAKDTTSVKAPGALAVWDFDGDKIPDLVVSHTGAPWALTFMKGNGDGTFGPEQQIGTSFAYDTNNLIAVELNRDGKARHRADGSLTGRCDRITWEWKWNVSTSSHIRDRALSLRVCDSGHEWRRQSRLRCRRSGKQRSHCSSRQRRRDPQSEEKSSRLGEIK